MTATDRCRKDDDWLARGQEVAKMLFGVWAANVAGLVRKGSLIVARVTRTCCESQPELAPVWMRMSVALHCVRR